MRFRQRFPTAQMILAPLWIAVSIAWLRKPHAIAGIRGAYTVIGLLNVLVLILYLSNYLFVWWDITDHGIRERRLWDTRFIPWDAIDRVHLWRPSPLKIKTVLGETLEVEYARTGPMPDRGSILLLPRKRQSFLLALRTHAPQAAIEL